MAAEITVGGLALNLGSYLPKFEEALKKATADRLVERIWSHDHTIWKPEPTEITNRLGWLDIANRMLPEASTLRAFADEVRNAGMDRVLLLGMGGSSLAPDLFSRLFTNGDGPTLEVLDSTDPETVAAKAASHPVEKTLFIVSSKSGGTVETFSFFKYFYNLVKEKLGKDAGSHFVAITDPGSGLAKIGEEFVFRRIFLADPNIGGRYSALSRFGLVPAALVGADLDRLLSAAEEMAAQCANKTVTENPGAVLGLALGALALHGRDKVTFALPDLFLPFAEWAEQLIAESTGKGGKGILPVAGEPALEASSYGNDRVFVHTGEAQVEGAASIRLSWEGNGEIGGQFFLWEFAIAVAGYALGINPFDQPNVEAAKVQSRHVMDQYRSTGVLPKAELESLSSSNLSAFLNSVPPGAYIALQAYAPPSDKLTSALQGFRGRLATKYRVATTLGYGPRFLHSTGQLHKGDAGNGIFVQFLTQLPKNDLAIPNEAGQSASDISFGVLKTAQALGDAAALRTAGRRVITFEAESADLPQAIDQLGI